jgi:N6-adenosine-specific RNA methylase IME4/ParB-like chromosome segregation protein Spo0J
MEDKMPALEAHPAAGLFPMMDEQRHAELVADIREHGLLVPIVLCEGKILDGRNRYRACLELGVESETCLFDGTNTEAINYVWSANFHRRHLTSSQAAMALAERKKMDPDFASAVIEPIQEEAKEALAKGQRSGGKTAGRGRQKDDSSEGFFPQSKRRPQTRDKVATLHNTNAKSVAKCEKILEEHPEFVEAIKKGDKSITQVEREVKKQEIAKVIDWPKGKYRVLYADPPWSYGNTMPEGTTEQRDHYPTMPLKDICALPVKDLALDNAVLFLWVTSPILEESFQVIKAWGFKYKTSFIWDKIKHNMGHYNSVRHELLLVAVRGSCPPDVAKLYDSVYSEERTEHSKKPDFFYEVINAIYPHGPRIELFARQQQEGWERYGHQA